MCPAPHGDDGISLPIVLQEDENPHGHRKSDCQQRSPLTHHTGGKLFLQFKYTHPPLKPMRRAVPHPCVSPQFQGHDVHEAADHWPTENTLFRHPRACKFIMSFSEIKILTTRSIPTRSSFFTSKLVGTRCSPSIPNSSGCPGSGNSTALFSTLSTHMMTSAPEGYNGQRWRAATIADFPLRTESHDFPL